MYTYYENYKGINDLAVVKTGNIITTSKKGMDVAIKNHKRKLKKLNENQI